MTRTWAVKNGFTDTLLFQIISILPAILSLNNCGEYLHLQTAIYLLSMHLPIQSELWQFESAS